MQLRASVQFTKWKKWFITKHDSRSVKTFVLHCDHEKMAVHAFPMRQCLQTARVKLQTMHVCLEELSVYNKGPKLTTYTYSCKHTPHKKWTCPLHWVLPIQTHMPNRVMGAFVILIFTALLSFLCVWLIWQKFSIHHLQAQTVSNTPSGLECEI